MDADLRGAMAARPDAVAIVTAGDVSALRYALSVRHLDASVPLVVSISDRTIARHLQELLDDCTVFSPADLIAPSLAGQCLDERTLAIWPTADGATAVRIGHGRPESGPWRLGLAARRRAFLARLGGQLRPFDGDTRLLLGGPAGILVVLGIDWVWLTTVFHKTPSTAFLEAARVVSGVGPAVAHPGHAGYEVAAGAMMLATIGVAAMLTAGLVNRLLGDRLVSLTGRRVLPRSGHVLVVGMGQVGLRLCQALRELGSPVVAVERDPAAPDLRLARSLGIPVVLAHGEDREVVHRLGLRRASALAVVGSDELDNIAVAVAAHAVAPGVRVVLRAGDDDATAETRALLPLGVTRDMTRAAAVFVLAHLAGERPRHVVAGQDLDYLDMPERGLVPATAPLLVRPRLGSDA
ncbi:NAD-binding protein [Streptomyces sp. NPDC058486]|uniref:NAD-binding protein n=1 Tax=unclassified Streptomyces TaxID=2593676 RepID=UPI00366698F1